MSDWDDINREIDNSLGLNQDYWGESNYDYYSAAAQPKYGRHPLTGKLATLADIEAYNASLTPATTPATVSTPKTTTEQQKKEHEALQAVNSQADVNYAEDLVDFGEKIQKEMNIEKGKALAIAAAAFAATGPIGGAIASLKQVHGLSQKEAEKIAAAANDLISTHNLDASRRSDISKAIGNLANSSSFFGSGSGSNSDISDPTMETDNGGIDNDLSAKVIGALQEQGVANTDQTTEDTESTYEAPERPIWEDFVNTHYDNAFTEYTNQADQINAAADKRTSLLDGLVTDLGAGNNTQPISFSIGGQEVSFIPRPNRDTAELMSDLSADSMTADVYSANEGNAKLNYLDALEKLAAMENDVVSADESFKLDAQGLATDAQRASSYDRVVDAQEEANEASILDYITAGAGALDSIGKIFNW